MLTGFSTPEGTKRYKARFDFPAFFRDAQGVSVSSIGIGTYLGPKDEATDAGYVGAIRRAIEGGINFIDTSLNYRHQRSERNIAAAISTLNRDELVICTKAGYLVPGAVPREALRPEDIVGKMHSLAPAFLSDQIDRSLENLGLATVDVFYLHNPETQLEFVPETEFYSRIRAAFETAERLVIEGKIRFYGAATWNGFRKTGPGSLSLTKMASIAREIAGEVHRFRFVQLPVNVAMPEAFTTGFAEAARDLGITVVASASLLQARFARDFPDGLAARLGPSLTNAQRALQFTRSMPGVTVALVGMSRRAHVEENLALASMPAADGNLYSGLFERSA
jgi:aryl-alcohol dehydrogenase-like predicted oxidoreductase